MWRRLACGSSALVALLVVVSGRDLPLSSSALRAASALDGLTPSAHAQAGSAGAAQAPAHQTLADLDPSTRAGVWDALHSARPAAEDGVVTFNNLEQRMRAAFANDHITVGGRDGARVRFSRARVGRNGAFVAMSGGVLSGAGTAEVTIARVAGGVAVTEWWRNRADGIEQGFTLAARPAGKGLLEVEQPWVSSLAAAAASDGTSVTFSDDRGQARLQFGGVRAWDASGRTLPARMRVAPGGAALTFVVDDAAAAYPITIDPVWSQQAYLKASNTDAADNFGWAVSISGDTLVVGAPFEESGATGVNGNQADNGTDGAGAVYVFVRSGATWTQQAYLKASNTNEADHFGSAVSVSGDTLVVGAEAEDSNATGVNGNESDNSFISSGAAYVFVRNGTTWSQQAYLKASNTGNADTFGYAVAVSGDTVAVSAILEDSAATGVNGDQVDNNAGGSGAVYVFVRSGSTWTQQAYVKASNTGSADLFGNALAISGDTLVVGSYAEDSAATGVNGNLADNNRADSGAVYVFRRTGTTWAQEASLKASNTGAGDRFGFAVAVSGDTIVVGAYREDSSATGVNGNQADNSLQDSGAAYVFVRSGSTWFQEAYLKASNSGFIDQFGYSVAVYGDRAVVGSLLEASNATGVNGNQANDEFADSGLGAGAAYAFGRVGATWSQQAYLKASNTGEGDAFASAVALSGNTIVVGAKGEDSSASGVNAIQSDDSAAGAGAAYVFRSSGASIVDLNGDSNGDAFIIKTATGGWAVQNTTAGGAFTGTNGAWSPNWTVTAATFNSDAFTDFFLFNTTNGQWFKMLSDGSGNFTAQAFAAWGTNWQRFVVDLDGDGLSDVFLWDPALGEWFQCLTGVGGAFTYVHGFWSAGWEVYAARFNADAQQDFFLFNRATAQWFWAVGGAGASFTYPASAFWATDWQFTAGDYNGDGLSDLFLFRPNTGFWFVAMNNGASNFIYTSGFFTTGYTFYPTDLDADGRTDLFLHNASTGQWFEILSDGAGGFTNAGGSAWSLGWSLFTTDFNADGRGDLLLYSPTTGTWFQARNLALGTFSYTSGFWDAGLTIVATP